MQPQGSKEMEEEKWMRYFNEFIEGRIRDVILSLSRVEIPEHSRLQKRIWKSSKSVYPTGPQRRSGLGCGSGR